MAASIVGVAGAADKDKDSKTTTACCRWITAVNHQGLFMAIQRYFVTPHPIKALLIWVESGEIAIPEIHRLFVWDAIFGGQRLNGSKASLLFPLRDLADDRCRRDSAESTLADR